MMHDSVFSLMRCFPDSRILPGGVVSLDRKNAITFTVEGVEKENEIIYKLLEWGSRPIAKGQIYAEESKNRDYRRSLLLGFNQFLHTHFTEADMYLIYDRLGNGVNRKATITFVDCGFDLEFLERVKEWD